LTVLGKKSWAPFKSLLSPAAFWKKKSGSRRKFEKNACEKEAEISQNGLGRRPGRKQLHTTKGKVLLQKEGVLPEGGKPRAPARPARRGCEKVRGLPCFGVNT